MIPRSVQGILQSKGEVKVTALPSPTCSPNKFFGRRERLAYAEALAQAGYAQAGIRFSPTSLPTGRQACQVVTSSNKD
jgi:hypothetical protein